MITPTNEIGHLRHSIPPKELVGSSNSFLRCPRHISRETPKYQLYIIPRCVCTGATRIHVSKGWSRSAVMNGMIEGYNQWTEAWICYRGRRRLYFFEYVVSKRVEWDRPALTLSRPRERHRVIPPRLVGAQNRCPGRDRTFQLGSEEFPGTWWWLQVDEYGSPRMPGSRSE